MQIKGAVGVDNEIGNDFKTTLEAVLRDLQYAVQEFNDPTRWLKKRAGNLAVVAIPRRSPQDVRTMREVYPESVIVGASHVAPEPETFRHYLKVGANALMASDQTRSELAVTLAATMAGLVVIPPNVSHALVSRLKEPPPNLEVAERDRAVLRLIAQGATRTQIAAATGYSDRHLRRITAEILASIGATNRAHAAAIATRWGSN